jgi:hypothetical protein
MSPSSRLGMGSMTVAVDFLAMPVDRATNRQK